MAIDPTYTDQLIERLAASEQFQYEQAQAWKQRAESTEAVAQQHAQGLRAALATAVRRCGCGEVALYMWEDEDGEEYVCEQHKAQHFFAHGPTEIEHAREWIAALAATPAPATFKAADWIIEGLART